MLKVKFFQNLIIARGLLTAESEYIINKSKKPKRKSEPLKTAFPPFSAAKFDINSRLITVEGCFGVNKSEIAKKIADRFALKYIDDVAEETPYTTNVEGKTINFIKYNDMLPDNAKIYTSKMFWNDPDPIKNGKPLMMQLLYYKNRYFNCCQNMARMLTDGDGVVMKRSPFADHVLALTYRELGLMSAEAYKYYNKMRLDSIVSLWRPHFIIYVKANPEIIRKNMKKTNDPMLNYPNFTDKFIETYQHLFETAYLDKQIGFSKIITIDLSETDFNEEEDFLSIVEHMANENIDLDNISDYSPLFRDWCQGTKFNRMITSQFYFCSAWSCYKNAFPLTRIPRAVSEGAFNDEAIDILSTIFYNDSRFWNAKLNPLEFTSLKNILFHIGKFNYQNPMNQPFGQFLKFIV